MLLLAGCADRTLRVESGVYTPDRAFGDLASLNRSVIESLTVDLDAMTAAIALRDGTVAEVELIERDSDTWPSGCPTNIYSNRMQVFDVAPAPLTLADVTLDKPVLVRNCPDDPARIVLREDGEIGGAITACGESCVIFVLEPAAAD